VAPSFSLIPEEGGFCLKILFLQDHRQAGGAARAANRYAAVLGALGCQVARVVGDESISAQEVRVTGKPPRGWPRILEMLLGRKAKNRLRQRRVAEGWLDFLFRMRPDLVWVHNLHGGAKWGWSEAMVATVPKALPVLWTLHDMWPLGRGRAFFGEKNLAEEFPRSPAAQEYLRRPSLVLTSPSRWLQEQVRTVHPGKCVHLPYVLDVDLFCPAGRATRRAELGLRPGDLFFLAAAENLADPRKRVSLLLSAWRKARAAFPGRRALLGLLGRNAPANGGEDCRALGLVTDDHAMASFYAAADLFLHVAEAESFGQVLEESQACGTPVMTALAGGTPETFLEGITGWGLAEPVVGCLDTRLSTVLARPDHLASMRQPARELMLSRHGGGQFANRWNELIREIRDEATG